MTIPVNQLPHSHPALFCDTWAGPPTHTLPHPIPKLGGGHRSPGKQQMSQDGGGQALSPLRPLAPRFVNTRSRDS